LYLLALIPLFAAAYVWLLRRRRRFAVRYSSLSLVREAASHQSWVRRHLPFLLFLFAFTSLILALARPTASVVIPSNRATIILAMDVSLSMCSTDISPNRLQAAKEAALSFVESRDPGTRIGIVAFAGFAELIQPPTDDKEILTSAITYAAPPSAAPSFARSMRSRKWTRTSSLWQPMTCLHPRCPLQSMRRTSSSY
jgi:Ca-activated chloride channel family protein